MVARYIVVQKQHVARSLRYGTQSRQKKTRGYERGRLLEGNKRATGHVLAWRQTRFVGVASGTKASRDGPVGAGHASDERKRVGWHDSAPEAVGGTKTAPFARSSVGGAGARRSRGRLDAVVGVIGGSRESQKRFCSGIVCKAVSSEREELQDKTGHNGMRIETGF